VGRKGLEPLTN